MSNFFITFLYELLEYKDATGENLTQYEVWTEITWSMYWLQEGVHPDRCSNNIPYTCGMLKELAKEPLAEGYFGVMWVLMGDLDYMHKVMHFADFNKPSEPCSLCRANNTDVPWTDFRLLQAIWVLRGWSNLDYKIAKGDSLHRILRHIPGLGVNNYIPDIMHSKHLGPDKSLAGSTLKSLTHHVMPDGPAKNLKALFREVQNEYRKEKTSSRFGAITERMIHSSTKRIPELRGKAAQIRDLIPILAALWEKKMDMSLAHHRDVLAALKSSAAIDEILHDYRGHYIFPEHVRAQFRQHCFDYSTCVTALIQHYHPAIPLYNITTKNHAMAHLGLIASFINPNLGARWQGEDMMRHLRTLAHSVTYGNSPARAQVKAMEKYAMAIGYEFSVGSRI